MKNMGVIIKSALCYLEREEEYLMLHRNSRENDVNKDKWIGVGGKLEFGESPEDCLCREVLEETGYVLQNHRFCGIVTFVYGEITEIMYLYVSDDFTGVQTECDEGELVWVKKKDVPALPVWEGDRLFLKLLDDGSPFFSLKLVYDGNGSLTEAFLDGKKYDAQQ